ncbi:XRE family transcriptional regulator [Pseudomonas jessenii]|jgi:predicted XRE-type DNA-binding protein|uniref:XRE family transcriptional regulator n=1 Tax=Pseudomonas jessenii TaxID=77298 RepID=A0A5C4KQS5_PSEJE|nr:MULTISPECIES: XRE family transcriptional regulator [Pseudomonas]MBY8958579.1 XRE family transcriptional regulator [Pseudomonas sp. MIS38]TNB90627.1 XRE family transcriptional regulator [Pseudomonas jessenii]
MKHHPPDSRRFTSVWDALEDTPQDAANMRLRAKLMRTLCETIRAWELPQKDTAMRLGITQPRLNNLINGKIDNFTLGELANLEMSLA